MRWDAVGMLRTHRPRLQQRRIHSRLALWEGKSTHKHTPRSTRVNTERDNSFRYNSVAYSHLVHCRAAVQSPSTLVRNRVYRMALSGSECTAAKPHLRAVCHSADSAELSPAQQQLLRLRDRSGSDPRTACGRLLREMQIAVLKMCWGVR